MSPLIDRAVFVLVWVGIIAFLVLFPVLLTMVSP